MKYCTKGNHEVSIENFSKSSKNKDGLHAWCKICIKLYSVENYTSGGKERKNNNTARYINRNKDYIWDLLSESACIDCGIADPRVLEFDHIDPKTKTQDVAFLMYNSGLKKLQDEIDKCEIRCSNCHTIKTSIQFGFWRTMR